MLGTFFTLVSFLYNLFFIFTWVCFFIIIRTHWKSILLFREICNNTKIRTIALFPSKLHTIVLSIPISYKILYLLSLNLQLFKQFILCHIVFIYINIFNVFLYTYGQQWFFNFFVEIKYLCISFLHPLHFIYFSSNCSYLSHKLEFFNLIGS